MLHGFPLLLRRRSGSHEGRSIILSVGEDVPSRVDEEEVHHGRSLRITTKEVQGPIACTQFQMAKSIGFARLKGHVGSNVKQFQQACRGAPHEADLLRDGAPAV